MRREERHELLEHHVVGRRALTEVHRHLHDVAVGPSAVRAARLAGLLDEEGLWRPDVARLNLDLETARAVVLGDEQAGVQRPVECAAASHPVGRLTPLLRLAGLGEVVAERKRAPVALELAQVAKQRGEVARPLDASVQLVDQGQDFDRAIAEELGRSYAERLDVQLISGGGSSGEMTGFRNVASIVAVTATTPVTPLGVQAKIADAAGQISTGRGVYPDVAVTHGRRFAWMVGQSASPTPMNWPGVTPLICNSIPTDVSSTQDVIVLLVTGDHPLYLTPPRLRVMTDFADSANLTARFVVDGYATVQNERYPSSIGVISGAALTTPSYA